MPASEAQIASNTQNAQFSTGPTSESGRARSALNSTRHGLSGVSPDVEARLSPEFLDRRAKWAAEQNPVGEAGNFALDRVVAATFRIARCERAIDDHTTEVQQRAKLAWDQDRDLEAAMIAARLAKDPVLASRQLRTTLSGVVLLIEAWLLLASTLDPGDWSESETSKALDLLGVAPDSRSGQTRIDPLDGSDRVAFRVKLVLDELNGLETLRDVSMVPLDELERRHAMLGGSALLSKQAKLLLRYEREAWKHFNDSMKELKAHAQDAPPVEVAPAPAPVVESRPQVQKPAVAAPKKSFEEERRALLAEAAPFVKTVTDRLVAEGFVDEDAWFKELDRRNAAFGQVSGSFIPMAVGSMTSSG
jgi:hypothetical protein